MIRNSFEFVKYFLVYLETETICIRTEWCAKAQWLIVYAPLTLFAICTNIKVHCNNSLHVQDNMDSSCLHKCCISCKTQISPFIPFLHLMFGIIRTIPARFNFRKVRNLITISNFLIH